MSFTMQDYSNIPLQFLLNKKMFERAHSVCIYATRIDSYFSETYLSLLQPKTRLTIGYFEADEDTRIYLENLRIRRLSLVPGAGKSVNGMSFAAMRLPSPSSHVSSPSLPVTFKHQSWKGSDATLLSYDCANAISSSSQ